MCTWKVIRSCHFAYDSSGKNLTLEALQRAMVESFKKVSGPDNRHLPGSMSLHYVCGRGDWKWKTEWLQESRSYSNLRQDPSIQGGSFCRRCDCNSDLHSMHWADFDKMPWFFSGDALQTLNSTCSASLPLRDLPYWSPDMECADTLHNFWMGPCRDASGSILLDIVQMHPDFAQMTWNEGLQELCSRLWVWCSEHGLDASVIEELSLVKLSVDAISYDFPKGPSKGFAVRILMSFLSHFLRDCPPDLQVHSICAWSACHFQAVLDACGMWLSRDQAERAALAGMTYARCHLLLARVSLEKRRPRFKIRPKLHSFVCEVCCKLLAGSTLNPRMTAAWSDESYIGKVCNIGCKAAIHMSTLGRRMLQRLLMQLNAHVAADQSSRAE